ncbi:MAG: DUF4159 domain-containing protein [Planctomycetota bacterium]|jgi:hypothetical protein
MGHVNRVQLAFAWAVAAAQVILGLFAAGAAADITAEQLERRIAALVLDIRTAQDDAGALTGPSGWARGQTALGVLALRAAGVPADDRAITRAVSYLLKRKRGDQYGVYETSLQIMALQSVDSKRFRKEIAAGADYLISAQQASGGWSYGESGPTDNSNSQFALLGLNAAALSGVEIPDAVWQQAREYFVGGQHPNGGWSYRARSGSSYGSMTAAGVASLYICDLWLHVSGGRCGVYPDDRRLRAGLQWLAKNFSVTRNPRYGHWKFYYLYALERVGVILAERHFGPHDWYREGVEHLVGDPEARVLAPSRFEWPFLQKCFMLLFLAKGNAPLLVHKVRWAGDWNPNRYDMRFLMRFIGRLLDQQVDWQVLPLDAPLSELMAAPILYVSGSGAARWSPEEAMRLREYMAAGGFVLVEAANGDQVFDRTFRALLKEHFPGDPLVSLSKDHPVYTSYFEIPVGERPRLSAVKGPCWISLLYAPDGLSCEWDVAQFDHVSFKLGANIAAYATGMEELEGKLTERTYYVPSLREAAPRRGAFTLGQVVHGGDWQPHKLAWLKVLEKVNAQAGIAAYSKPLPLRVDVESPFQAQMLYLTGVEELKLNAESRKALKLYLQRGGFIFAEAACGSARFDRSFRTLMREMFPGEELRVLPLGHPLLESGEPLGKMKYSVAVRRVTPELARPVLEFIELDGRAAIVYSKYDLSSAIDGHPCHTCLSILEPTASRLAVKIVLYGLAS